jgi:EAL domain-containing protein (putative c-di-GMP-specific phosphodiesterase class I)
VGAAPGLAELALSVNVSPLQFQQPQFVQDVEQALASHGVRPDRLKLELTEGMLLSDVEDTIRKMEQLRGLGVAFSLDDFGTGYSSLSYLKRLPLEQLKIDQSFVRKC